MRASLARRRRDVIRPGPSQRYSHLYGLVIRYDTFNTVSAVTFWLDFDQAWSKTVTASNMVTKYIFVVVLLCVTENLLWCLNVNRPIHYVPLRLTRGRELLFRFLYSLFPIYGYFVTPVTILGKDSNYFEAFCFHKTAINNLWIVCLFIQMVSLIGSSLLRIRQNFLQIAYEVKNLFFTRSEKTFRIKLWRRYAQVCFATVTSPINSEWARERSVVFLLN